MYDLKVSSVVDTVRWATHVYREEKELFRKMQVRSMSKEMGWDIAAKRYQDVYGWALERKGSGITSRRR